MTAVRRRTLSGKVVEAEIDEGADLRSAVDGLIGRIRDAAERREAEIAATERPGAPVTVVLPEGNGDRRARRAAERSRKRDNLRRRRAAMGG